MLSEQNFSEEAYLLLIKSGAKIDVLDQEGKSIKRHLLRRAVEKHYNQLAEEIFSRSTKRHYPFVLELAVKCKNIEIAEFLLNLGTNPNSISSSANPLIFTALQSSDFEIANLLIQHGTDINAELSEGPILFRFSSPYSKDPDMIKLTWLLDNDANINCRSKRYKWTPLMQASLLGYVSAVKLLLDRGADVNIKSTTGQTALSVAANKVIKDMIKEKKKSKRCLIS